jgi:DEAD/DEAH box helicase domain-containing protein
MHAAAHAVCAVLPLFLTCSPADVATECDWAGETHARPLRLLIFDKMVDGSGLAQAAQRVFGDALAAAAALVEQCDCGASGCVACVQSLACGSYNAELDKPAAAAVLRAALAALHEDAAAA